MAKIQINSLAGMLLYEPKVGDELELKEFGTTVKVIKAPCCDKCFLDDSTQDMPDEEREKYYKYCGAAICVRKLESYNYQKVD